MNDDDELIIAKVCDLTRLIEKLDKLERMVEELTTDRAETAEAPRYYSTAEAAEYLGMGAHFIRSAARDGRLAHMRIGNRDKYTREDLDAFAKARRIKTDNETKKDAATRLAIMYHQKNLQQ